MVFAHHQLEAYQRALDVLDACDKILEDLPPDRTHARDQLDRAACAILTSIAEGAGELSQAEKIRCFRAARRSVIEVIAWLEIIDRRGDANEIVVRDAMAHLEVVGSMLVRLIQGKSY